MSALERLLDRIGDPLDDSKPHPLVTIEEFFTDNNDPESLGLYARDRFDPPDFYAALNSLRGCYGIHDVRVEILPRLSRSGWPYSDTVWIVSDFKRSELTRQLTTEFWDEFLPCDWLSFPRTDNVPMESISVPNGASVFGLAYF